MASGNLSGIVIKHTRLNDSDIIIKILSLNKGLVSAIVKGARKIPSKKGGSVDLLNHIQAHIVNGKSLDILTEVEVINDYLSIKKDLFKVSLAYYLFEILASAEYDEIECSKIYTNLIIVLDRLRKSKSKLTSVLVVKIFELQYLELTGYKMQIPDKFEFKDLFKAVATDNLEKLRKIKYNSESVKRLSDAVQIYTETVMDRKFKKINLLI